MSRLILVLLISLVSFAPQVAAHDNAKGNIVVSHPWTRATVPSAKVGVGYMEIINEGKQDDRLIGASASFAGVTQIHEMKVQNDVMRMREVDGGIAVPAGSTVMLERGGLHVMFMQLKQPLVEGEMHKVTLEFEKAGTMEIDLLVEAMGSAQKEAMKHDHMEHDKKSDDHAGHAH